MNVTADAVKQLRERTGAGMMECKKALVETQGDLDAAAELMRKQGLAKADKKARASPPKGVIVVERSPRPAPCMVEINCETDFVAREQDFRRFARASARRAGAGGGRRRGAAGASWRRGKRR
jgi:elongation factor Ts